MKLSFIISSDDTGKTVKYILKNRLNISEHLVKKMKFSDRIMLNSASVHVNAPVKEGDIVEACIDADESNEAVVPEPMKLDIIFEDESLIVINKPSDMVVHPTTRHFTGTIANGLMYYLLQKNIKTLVRPVSRLDRDTSGIIVFALNPFVQESLIRQMHSKTYLKEYIGIVHGSFSSSAGTIDLPIERLEGSIMLRHISNSGAPSVTHYEVLEQYNNAALLKFILETGRTHQIRVHCQAIGHPLVGDTLYPLPQFECVYDSLMSRQALHSFHASFKHPVTGEQLDFTASIPSDMNSALEILRNKPV